MIVCHNSPDMSKNHRGKPLRSEHPKSGRGTCPITHRSGVKLLYEYEIKGKKLLISKTARATLENKRRRAERAARSGAEDVPSDTTETRTKETAPGSDTPVERGALETGSTGADAATERAPASTPASIKVAPSASTSPEEVSSHTTEPPHTEPDREGASATPQSSDTNGVSGDSE